MSKAEEQTALAGKRILIFQQRGWAINIGQFLAKKFQAEGCRLAALTFKRTTHNYILKQKEVEYDLIINNDQVMSNPKEYLQGDCYSLKEICDELGIDSVWLIVMSLRNHVMSYKDKYYYGFKQNVPDEEITDYIKAVYKYINEIFNKFKPDIIIAPNFVSLPHIMFNLFAEKRGVKMIAPYDSKVSGYRIFSHNYKNSEGYFHSRVDDLNQGKAKSNNIDKARQYIKEFREKFIKPDYAAVSGEKKSLIKTIKREIAPYYNIIQWFFKKEINYMESIGVSIDYKPPSIILRDHYSNKKYKKFADNYNYYPLNKIEKFVYFPLQVQPEAIIDVLSPYFSNQIETARNIAMSLPDNYTLVVKEHPGMYGLRTPSYLEKVARTPNVKLINYRISNEEILKRADLIISPSGTSLAEAAFYYKPSIQLGDLGTTLRFPNVFKHTDMTTLSKKIKELINADLKNEEYERRLENYIAAVYDVGFNTDYLGAWFSHKRDNLEIIWKIYLKEIEKILFKM